jgi:ribonuclease HI
VLRKSDPELNCRVLALDMISGYADRLHIYTDGSKDEEGRVACSVCVPEKDVGVGLRLSDKLSVFTAELAAIRKALELSRDYCSAGETRNIVVFSDSLSAIQSLDSNRPYNRPDIVRDIFDIKESLANLVTISWIPAHVGIHGNELADKLAKGALKHSSIDLALLPEGSDVTESVDEYVLGKWQEEHNSSTIAKHNKTIQPIVNTKTKFTDPNRKKEVALTRLRLGVCKLNYYLHIQRNHDTGLCRTCGVPETIKHYLMSCRGCKIKEVLQTTCIKLNIPFQLDSLLSNTITLNIIYENLTVSL